MIQAIYGAILLGCWTIGLFFFRYWRQTREKLFLYFGITFWLLAVERFLLISVDPRHEFQPYIYLVRLAAFLLILYAIFKKNSDSQLPRF